MSNKLSELAPDFRTLVDEFLKILEAEGIEYEIEWTHRNRLEQARLFSMGRIQEASEGFTQNRPGESFHNYGMAIDLYPMVNGRVKRDHPDIQNKMGAIAKKLGLVWGGDFNPPEMQHFQMPGLTLTKLQLMQAGSKNGQ